MRRCSSLILCFKFADSVVCLIFDIVGDRDEEKSFACRAPLFAGYNVLDVVSAFKAKGVASFRLQVYKSEACKNA